MNFKRSSKTSKVLIGLERFQKIFKTDRSSEVSNVIRDVERPYNFVNGL